MEQGQGLLQCYNRGCGKKYKSEENFDDSCQHHPGAPIFHDAYKGWSCCNKKCTDFTEFLNIKGCTLSKHSNIKPVEPEKPKQTIPDEELIEVKQTPLPLSKPRPPIDTPMIELKPNIAPALKQAQTVKPVEQKDSDEITVGTMCKNGGCRVAYEGPHSNDGVCIFHSGCPVFHEGMKYWTCCQRKTTDFNSFLNQEGCERGIHNWKTASDKRNIQCRWDYHQTGTHVIVSVYAKNYCPKTSIVRVNPVRLFICLVFPESSNASFEMDVELQGIIDVAKCELSMYGTKVEIKLKKAEPGSWKKLELRKLTEENKPNEEEKQRRDVINISSKIEDVDLSDL